MKCIIIFSILLLSLDICWESDDSSQTNLSLDIWIINLRWGFGVRALGVWAWDEFWGRTVTDSYMFLLHDLWLRRPTMTEYKPDLNILCLIQWLKLNKIMFAPWPWVDHPLHWFELDNCHIMCNRLVWLCLIGAPERDEEGNEVCCLLNYALVKLLLIRVGIHILTT